MQCPRLYYDLAYLWPILDPPEDFIEEAGFWKEVLSKRLGAGKDRILELGVGGGHLLSHLASDFEVTAVDISPQMIALSRKLNPQVKHIVGDMRSVRLGYRYKAVLIHDAVSYLLTETDILETLETAADHLCGGGLLIMCPDWYRETFHGTYETDRISMKNGKSIFLEQRVSDVDPNDTLIETSFKLTFEENGDQQTIEDIHITGLFYLETWLTLMDKMGFDAEALPYPVYDDNEPGYLLVGRLR
jgi:SAM-dependent methyltransferase